MQVPKLEKIVINMGVGEAAGDQKKLDAAVAELTLIAGQKPVKTVAKKAIAGFKIRKGLPIGCKVTLRKARMYEFLDRLVTIALPRVRDFRGITGKGFDGRGNFAMGLKEQIIFPEIVYDKVDDDPRHGHRVRDHREDRCRSEGLAQGFRYSVRELSLTRRDFGKPRPPPGDGRQVPEDKTGWPRLPRSTATRSASAWRRATRRKRAALKDDRDGPHAAGGRPLRGVA